MKSLAKPLRKQLKGVVVKARGTAEDAVRAAMLGAAESEQARATYGNAGQMSAPCAGDIG